MPSIIIQRPTLEQRSFEVNPGDILLVLRARESPPVLGIFQEVSSQVIERVIGRGHEKRRLILKPALTLEPCAIVYGNSVPRIKFQRDLSFGLGTEIAEILVGKESVLRYFEQRNRFAHYGSIFSDLPEQGPYDPKQFTF
ncbi:hypothetical protein EXS74_01680 [Candidatus Woesearchaeota archaeon]|nr:hypothetical protein [Candidatus Woesearchaeota archaeon]